ncbi:hypothetical protein ACF1DY_07620 [Streptomyces albus]
MLAAEYGYQVSPRPAVETPGLRARLEHNRRAAARRFRRTAVVLLLPMLALLVVVIVNDWSYLLLLPGIVLAAGLWQFWLSSVVETPAQHWSLLTDFRWQAWPCRLEEIPGKVSVRRVLLLAPDKSVAASFQGRVPHHVWFGMTDGRGVLWIAGDLRFPVVAALPGGAALWRMTPEEQLHGPRPQGDPDDSSVFDGLVSEARSVVVWSLLNCPAALARPPSAPPRSSCSASRR